MGGARGEQGAASQNALTPAAPYQIWKLWSAPNVKAAKISDKIVN